MAAIEWHEAHKEVVLIARRMQDILLIVVDKCLSSSEGDKNDDSG